MTLDDFALVNRIAIDSIETLLWGWFPNGVIEGDNFCIGSVDGEAGKSLRIRLTGTKAGVWSDFSATDVVGSDLISLYAAIEGIEPGPACAAIAAQLGITLSGIKGRHSGAKPRAASAKQKTPPKRAPAQADKGVGENSAARKAQPAWRPMLPVPADAGPYPRAHVVRGRPQALWEYRDGDGELLGVIYRFLCSNGVDKEVLPCVYAEHPVSGARQWRWMAFPEPRPLYQRGPYRADMPVMIVEGEKCVDAVYPVIVEAYDVASWPGGGKAVAKADWSAYRDRDVVLWADADAKVYKAGHVCAGQIMPEHEQPGMVAMHKIAEILRGQGCRVRFVDIPAPGEVEDGWDVADLIAAGASNEEVMAWATKLRPEPEPVPEPEAEVDVPDWIGEQFAEQLDTLATAVPAGASKRSKKAELRAMLIQTANGGVKGCRENVFTVMQHDERLCGIVGLDLFSGLPMKRKATPWKSEPGEWTEADDFHLGLYMAKHHGLVVAAIGDIERGAAQAAREHAFNPVTDYLDQCKSMWDGCDRVSTAFSTYWGCPDSEYMRLIATMFMVSIVVRAYRPGVKHDHAPVFEGGQGEGKSTALKVLGGEWFADTPFRMGEKDGYLSIQGVLLYEVAELEQFNRSEVTAIKAFMSSTVDRFREPYGRRMKNVPRRCAFAATTNENEYFKDTTGNRRFWPAATGRIDIDALIRDRDQLFAEAIHMLDAGVLWYPTRDQQRRLIDQHQESREIPDPWHGRIYEYIEGMDEMGQPTLLSQINRVTVRQLLVKGLGFELSKLGPAKLETMRISAIMRKLGWVKGRDTDGARERYYERPPAAVKEFSSEVDNDLPF